MAYWATQAELEAKILSSRLKNWGDKDRDGLIETVSLANAFQEAQGVCSSFITERFGGYLRDWTATTVPYLIKSCYLDLAVWAVATGSNQISPTVQKRYEEALKTLQAIKEGTQDIYDEYNSAVLSETSLGFSDAEISPDYEERLFDFKSSRMPTQARAFDTYDTV